MDSVRLCGQGKEDATRSHLVVVATAAGVGREGPIETERE